MRFGICCSPLALGQGSARERASRQQEVLQSAGADYFEMGVGGVMGDDFDSLLAALEGQPLRPEAYNSFIPAHHRITGEGVDHDKVLGYCDIALGHCRALGGEVVVLGSAGARKVPEGFSRERALEQFVSFGKSLGPIAQKHGITVAIEPLNTREDNLINTVAHGAQLADAIGHPSIQLLADLHHITVDKEPLSNTGDAGKRLRHVHVADLGRVAPGSAKEGEAQFREFFAQCRRAGYESLGRGARCSFEGSFSNFESESRSLIALLKRRHEESAV
jgi:D-psicose/D-tagatose/L-ribulose 3-epimerase